jgi:cytolysin (calcineurin-like family phosphatase)
MSYDYRVTFVTDYLTITTNVCLELDDTIGNLSDAAYEQATINAMNNIEDEIGKIDETVINDITVTLLLDEEEIELGGFGEFPAVHVEVIE